MGWLILQFGSQEKRISKVLSLFELNYQVLPNLYSNSTSLSVVIDAVEGQCCVLTTSLPTAQGSGATTTICSTSRLDLKLAELWKTLDIRPHHVAYGRLCFSSTWSILNNNTRLYFPHVAKQHGSPAFNELGCKQGRGHMGGQGGARPPLVRGWSPRWPPEYEKNDILNGNGLKKAEIYAPLV